MTIRRRRFARLAGRGVASVAVAAVLLVAAPAPGLAPGWTVLPIAPSWAALAAAPTPTPAAAGDPRSSGEGAGLVGRPLLAIGGMLAIGLLAAAGTFLYVRLTGGPRRD